jgi:hypothetical protein
MLMTARECVTILLGLLFELAEIAQIFIIKYSTCQVFWLSKSHALSNRQRIRRKTATSGRMEAVRRSISRPYAWQLSQLRTEVDFIANFPEIHPIFPANSRSKSKLLTFRKLIRECSKVSFARGLFRKRDGAGIAPYQQGLLNHILPSNE